MWPCGLCGSIVKSLTLCMPEPKFFAGAGLWRTRRTRRARRGRRAAEIRQGAGQMPERLGDNGELNDRTTSLSLT